MSAPLKSLTITIEFENPQAVERALYKILNELDGPRQYKKFEVQGAKVEYVLDQFYTEAKSNGSTIQIFQSKINEL